jgi:hypothetical protein
VNESLTLNSSPLYAIALTVLTRIVGMIGAGLVAKGYADDATVASSTPEIVGGILAAGSLAWGWYRAQHLNTKQLQLRAADPATVRVK